MMSSFIERPIATIRGKIPTPRLVWIKLFAVSRSIPFMALKSSGLLENCLICIDIGWGN